MVSETMSMSITAGPPGKVAASLAAIPGTGQFEPSGMVGIRSADANADPPPEASRKPASQGCRRDARPLIGASASRPKRIGEAGSGVRRRPGRSPVGAGLSSVFSPVRSRFMSERFSVRGKRALVTGASSGLGRQFAITLAGEGARVALAARRVDRLEALAREIAAAGGEAVPIGIDVSDGGSVRDGVDRAVAGLGGIDVLVNNAGVVIHKPLLEHDEADWEAVTGVNLRGAYLVALECARRMVARGGGGSIINIASVIGHGRVAMQIPEYMAAKGGLVQLTRALGAELARHAVRVNAIAPGYIETDFNREFLRTEQGARLVRGIPQRRAGGPEELDGALLLLASDASSFMTGSVVTVDGGHACTSV